MNHLLFAIGLLTAVPLFAQHPNHSSSHSSPVHKLHQHEHSPYVGMEKREIKALSEQQVADIRSGKGMSLALPAELNGYPGPSHTLELAEPLGLSEEQKRKTQNLFAQMQAEAKTIGEQVITREYELDRLFKDRKASLESIQDAVARAAQVQGRLRTAHLNYHLKMVDILTPAQVENYHRLRGYK